ncbi:hypothetical protein JOQ06_020631 [Pogonophryne albipinna]|uniref:Uncharacterized protein n=1 Tax=Pogonophryne albipinna TaxID=1090488 RepID=A0AAD6FWG9_9TELE|nr:hypothetical protein JOQ06_020631 [Pogonophryne albipinna]
MHDGSPDPDQEANAWHQAQLEQRHLEAYRNMHRLRKAPCRRYAALLSDKVSSQRALLQRREEAARGKSESEAQQVERLCHRHRGEAGPKQTEARTPAGPKTREACPLSLPVCLPPLFFFTQKQKKLSFSKLLHDDSYLKPLPKTSYYLDSSLKPVCTQQIKCVVTRVRSVIGCELHHTIDTLEKILEHESGSGEGFAELIFGGSQEKEQTEQMFPKTLPSVDSKQGKTSQTNQAPLCSPKQQSSVRKDRPSCSPPLRRVTSASPQCMALSANPWQARKDQRGEEPTMSAPNTHPEPGFTLYIWELSMKSRDLR